MFLVTKIQRFGFDRICILVCTFEVYNFRTFQHPNTLFNRQIDSAYFYNNVHGGICLLVVFW